MNATKNTLALSLLLVLVCSAACLAQDDDAVQEAGQALQQANQALNPPAVPPRPARRQAPPVPMRPTDVFYSCSGGGIRATATCVTIIENLRDQGFGPESAMVKRVAGISGGSWGIYTVLAPIMANAASGEEALTAWRAAVQPSSEKGVWGPWSPRPPLEFAPQWEKGIKESITHPAGDTDDSLTLDAYLRAHPKASIVVARKGAEVFLEHCAFRFSAVANAPVFKCNYWDDEVLLSDIQKRGNPMTLLDALMYSSSAWATREAMSLGRPPKLHIGGATSHAGEFQPVDGGEPCNDPFIQMVMDNWDTTKRVVIFNSEASAGDMPDRVTGQLMRAQIMLNANGFPATLGDDLFRNNENGQYPFYHGALFYTFPHNPLLNLVHIPLQGKTLGLNLVDSLPTTVKVALAKRWRPSVFELFFNEFGGYMADNAKAIADKIKEHRGNRGFDIPNQKPYVHVAESQESKNARTALRAKITLSRTDANAKAELRAARLREVHRALMIADFSSALLDAEKENEKTRGKASVELGDEVKKQLTVEAKARDKAT